MVSRSWKARIGWGRALLFFLGLLQAGCRPAPEAGPAEPARSRRPDLLTLNERPGRSPYELHWGPVRIPLKLVANPNVYGGEAEVDLNEYWMALNGRLELYRGDEQQEVEIVSINREPWSWRRRLWFSYPRLRKGLLEPDVVSRLRDALESGEALSLRLRSVADSAHIHPVLIRIRDPFAPYRPEKTVDRWSDDGGVFGFQMIQWPGRPPLLRIDTTSADTRHIYQMYLKEAGYRIIHIPGFRTRRRYITGQDELFGAKEVQKTVLLCQEYDLLTLPEFTGEENAGYRLTWGDLVAAPSSANYRREEIRRHQGRPLMLWTGERRLTLLGFHLYISSRRMRPNLYIANDIQEVEIQRALARLRPESTLYFDRLVVADSSGNPAYLRGAFAFNVDAELEYELAINESAAGTPSFIRTIDERHRRQLLLRNQPLPAVLSCLLDTPQEALLFERTADEPHLDVSFSSASHTLAEGKNLLRHKLQELYHFTIEPAGERGLYRLIVTDSARLAAHRAPAAADDEIVRQFSITTGPGQRLLRFGAATLGELARFLGNELRIGIVDLSGRPGQRYDLEVDCRSLEAVRQQLQGWGLTLAPAPGEVRYVITRW